MHTIGELSERPLLLDQWQKNFIDEMYTVRWKHEEQRWKFVYQSILLGVTRGAGKSTLSAALGLYELSPLSGTPAPRVILAAATRENAMHVYGPARDMVNLSPQLRDIMRANQNIITCADNRGELKRVSADGKSNFGWIPSFIVRDELHTWETPRQELLSEALQTALAKREGAKSLAVTTAGYDKQTILGRLYDTMLKRPELEVLDGFMVLRDRENGFLFWWYEAPPDAPWDDPVTWRKASPSTHISIDAIRGVFTDPTISSDEFQRQWLNRFTKTRSAWLPIGAWTRCGAPPREIPDGVEIQLAIDAALTSDTTALAWAWQEDEDGPVIIDAHVWSAVEIVAHHTFVPGGKIDLRLVAEYITDVLLPKYRITEIVYDPRFFDTIATILSEAGFVVAEMVQGSAQMADAYQNFYIGARIGQTAIGHNGNAVLAEHIESTGAVETERGWKVFKLKNTKRIDACVAAVMAHSRARANTLRRGTHYTFRRSELEGSSETTPKA